MIAAVLSSRLRLATLADLDTVYGIEDLHDLLEVATVDALNRQIAARKE